MTQTTVDIKDYIELYEFKKKSDEGLIHVNNKIQVSSQDITKELKDLTRRGREAQRRLNDDNYNKQRIDRLLTSLLRESENRKVFESRTKSLNEQVKSLLLENQRITSKVVGKNSEITELKDRVKGLKMYRLFITILSVGLLVFSLWLTTKTGV